MDHRDRRLIWFARELNYLAFLNLTKMFTLEISEYSDSVAGNGSAVDTITFDGSIF
jgi:hypothetical protein